MSCFFFLDFWSFKSLEFFLWQILLKYGVSLVGLAWPQWAFISPAKQRPAAALTSTPEPTRPADEDEEDLEPGIVQPTRGEWLPRGQRACRVLGTLPQPSVGLREGTFGEPAPDTPEDPKAFGVAWKTAQKDLLWKMHVRFWYVAGSVDTKGGFRFPKTAHSPSSCKKHLREHLSHGTCQKWVLLLAYLTAAKCPTQTFYLSPPSPPEVTPKPLSQA